MVTGRRTENSGADTALLVFVGSQLLGLSFFTLRTGLHDLWVENFGKPEEIDWEAKRAHREYYVYDSGCVTCHTNLQEATLATNKAFIAHRDYYLGLIDDQCVTCHENVGHADLSIYISQHVFK